VTSNPLFSLKVLVLKEKRVKLPKIGRVRVRLHRPLPDRAVLKRAMVKKECDKWFVILSIELPEPTVSVPPVNVIGCDVGVKHLATFSNKTVLDGEQPLKKTLARLAKAQRNLKRKKTGSNNRKKQRGKVQKISWRVQNRRRDFLHKASAKLAETHDAIAFEKMNLGFINRSRFYSTARKSHDLGIGMFRMFCEYKFAERGKQVFHVDPKNTTKECSNCHRLVPKEIEDRTHLCPFCGLKMDRDVNAAINIRNRLSVATDSRDFKPVETETSASDLSVVSFCQ